MTDLKVPIPQRTAPAGRTPSALGPTVPVALTAAATTWLTMFAWLGFTQEPVRYLLPTFVVAAAIVAVGAVSRQWRVSGALTFLMQVVAALIVVFFSISGSLVPDRTGFESLFTAFEGAIDSAQLYTSPLPLTVPGVHPLLIVAGAVSLLAVDLLACTLRRASFVGIPLLFIYLMPSAMNGTPVDAWVFVVSAAGYLFLLFLTEFQLVGRWGRHLDRLTSAPAAGSSLGSSGHRTAGLGKVGVAHQRRQAISIGVPAIALAIVIALATPAWDLSGWGPGTGSRGGGDEITIENPMTDLRRDLTRGEDIPLLSVRTSDPRPDYLRIAVLNRFGSNSWTSGDRDFPDDQSARGQELPLLGVSPSVARREYDYTISTESAFDSTWLPTPSPASRVRADGAWKYDRTTIDFLAAADDGELNASDLTYTATAVDLEYDAEDLAAAPSGAGSVPSLFTKLPDNLPDVVTDLTTEVTRSAPSKFEKAVALQNWFRGNFEYSLETAPGSGSDELVAFLTEGNGGRIGYCEQFASAMAVMARTLNIPARVAIGFLRPVNISPNLWEYSAWDLHAWPELYFPGSGWVRFEPTPGARAETTPAYTRQQLPAPEQEPSTSAGPSASSSGGASAGREPNLPDEQNFQSTAQGSSWPLIAIGVAAAVALVVGLLLIPLGIRTWRRRKRWSSGPGSDWPEIAWTELHDTVIDLGRRWPSGLSPRDTRNRLVDWFGAPSTGRLAKGATPYRPQRGTSVNPDATAALDRIVMALEESRYAAASPAADAAALRADVEICSAGFRSGSTPVARRRATWWPVSALRRQRMIGATSTAAEGNQEVLEQVS